MSKVIKAILLSAFSFLLINFLRLKLGTPNVEIELEYVVRPPGALKKIMRDLKHQSKNNINQTITLERPDRLPTDLKYILRWMNTFSHYGSGSSRFRPGQTSFIENNCAHFNCFLTTDKSLLVDPRNFDAILYDVENNWDPPPITRAAHQKYIFTASESASSYPYCYSFYDTFYNLTWTYKLDSDIRWSIITIEDKKGKFVGPRVDMKWIEPMKPTPEDIVSSLTHKRKAAAWFVSNCKSNSGSEKIGKAIMVELAKHKLKVDTYGWCGELSCPRDRIDECLDLLSEQYYFYFSFENSRSEDYVTEKLLHALLHKTVPVVYGGANYSRFLPPGSYINAGELNATKVAFLMNKAIKNPEVYRDYFRWHNYYVYLETPAISDVCKLCEVLNDPSKDHAVVNNFRKWWDPNYEEHCKIELNETDWQTSKNIDSILI